MWLTVLVIWCIAYTVDSTELPSFIHVCHKADPNLKQCLVAAVEDLRPFLVTGVPEYNIPSLEPLVMDELISEETGGLKIETNNVKAYGCSDFFVRKMDVDVENQHYELYIDIPKLRIEAQYSIDGKILLMPIKGRGDFLANVTECKSRTVFKSEFYEKDGEKYLKFVDIELKIEVGGGKVQLSNLFGGDKILNDVINDTINKNFNLYLGELMPVIERALQSTFLKIANGIVESFTFKQLFPH